MISRIFNGMSLRDAERVIRDLGGKAEPIRRTGEVRFSHPSTHRTVKQNARRKDATREVVAYLRSIMQVCTY